ncbi:carboxylesterase/lipase family protein [Ramlibacter algicola]|uniref:Carboxylic ester hydrolase n=1 Tax=Ramlibacter algicola TaxID=2795217 RepID=A0A934URR9_9BURK|nr:carboxylesterase family protein [Ramlibacter algicola]MBK0392978.1 carboxylesterase family protein [Ramlibacter algicola]
MVRARKFLGRLAMAGAVFALAACGGGNDGGTGPLALVKSTHLGPVQGTQVASGAIAWKGIPFAAAPVGSLRWQPPQDPAPWTTARDATKFGNACSQYGRIYGPGSNNTYDATIGTTLNQAVGSEDCLYLNVWRPSGNQANLPVIVFFHGGSNVSGYTADPMYDGAALAQAANAIVVTPNFRVGILGFLSVPQLRTGDAQVDSGNFTLLDSIHALRWVQRNVQSFGGDPANVTVMGQSAGAINVWALQTSPLMVAANPRLFHRVMPLSGGISLPTNLAAGSIPTLSPAATYVAQGASLLQNLLIADGLATDATTAQAYIASKTDAEIATYLRGKSPSALYGVLLTKLALLGLSGSGPIPDGTVVAADPIAAIAGGNYVQVPVLAGNTRDEGKLFPSFLPLVGGTGNARIVTDAQLFANHLNYNPNAAPQTTVEQWITASYLPVNAPVTGFTARAETLNQVFFLRSRDNVLNTLKARQANVWYYRFDWDEQPAPWNDIYGAVHVADLPFLFGNFGPSLFGNVWFNEANKPGRLELSAAMMQTVGTFARNGDPNNASLGVAWPAWPGKLVFDASPTTKAIRTE